MIESTINITEQEFLKISQLIYKKFGIHLPDSKKTLVMTRLQKVLKENGCDTFTQYYDYLKNEKSGEGLNRLINRISTNFTYFYREPQHFKLFEKTILPQLQSKHKNDKKLRLWCAGCSTGEEAYTLTILLLNFFGEQYSQWDAGLLATDISERALAAAMKGQYPKEAIKKLPLGMSNYFIHHSRNHVLASKKLQNEVTFRRFNLMNKHFPFKTQFDVIFCRNVMIYFDSETRYELVERFHKQLTPGGFLLIGHSESLSRNHVGFKYIQPSVYQKVLNGS